MRWARAYGLAPGGGPRPVSLIGPGPDFDPGYAMTTDLDEPLIVASVPLGLEPPAPLLIDGCHRLYKAAALGRERLPSLVLTAGETLAIRHGAILGPAPAPGRLRRARTGSRP
jgi:hypothetical protein